MLEDDGGGCGVDGLVRQLVSSTYNLKSHFFDPHALSAIQNLVYPVLHTSDSHHLARCRRPLRQSTLSLQSRWFRSPIRVI